MKFASDKPTLRLYRFYFFGLTDAVTVAAYSKHQARLALKANWEKMPLNYQQSRVIGETVEVPIPGVSKRKIGTVTYVWSKGLAADNWTEAEAFEKKFGNRSKLL